MKWEEYMEASARTDTDRGDEAWDYYTSGLFGEVGEVIDLAKKMRWHGHESDEFILEVGDVAWHLAALCRLLGVCVKPFTYWNPNLKGSRQGTDLGLRALARSSARFMVDATPDAEPMKSRAVGWLEMTMDALVDVASGHGLDFEDVLHANIAKLRARYPDGWSEEASQRREA